MVDVLSLLIDFLTNSKQRVVFNGQNSSWADIKAGIPEGSILEPLFSLLYINDLMENLHLNPKLFADDTSLFSIVNIVAQSNAQLSSDLTKINDCAFKWKTSFNPDYTKPSHEVVFSCKRIETHHSLLMINNVPVKRVPFHKHLGLILDSKLDFNEHINTVLSKVNKMIAFFQKFQHILPRHSLLTIYKAFIRPHLDYGDVIYDKVFNQSFHKRLESVQYNAALAMTGAIRGTNTGKLYEELRLASLQNRHKLRRLGLFYKIYKDHTPPYLNNLIPQNFQVSYSLRTTNDIPLFRVKYGPFKSSFFPSTIIEWNNLDYHLRNAPSISVFKQNISKFIGLGPNKVYNVHNPSGLKLLTRLCLGLSHLRAHKFSHNFSDCLDEFWICGANISSSNSHYIYPKGKPLWRKSVMLRFQFLIKMKITFVILYSLVAISLVTLKTFAYSTIEYILSTEKFNVPL